MLLSIFAFQAVGAFRTVIEKNLRAVGWIGVAIKGGVADG